MSHNENRRNFFLSPQYLNCLNLQFGIFYFFSRFSFSSMQFLLIKCAHTVTHSIRSFGLSNALFILLYRTYCLGLGVSFFPFWFWILIVVAERKCGRISTELDCHALFSCWIEVKLVQSVYGFLIGREGKKSWNQKRKFLERWWVGGKIYAE